MKFKNFGNIDWAVKVCQLFGNFYNAVLKAKKSKFCFSEHKPQKQCSDQDWISKLNNVLQGQPGQSVIK